MKLDKTKEKYVDDFIDELSKGQRVGTNLSIMKLAMITANRLYDIAK